MKTAIRSATYGFVVLCMAATVASADDSDDTVLIYQAEPSKDSTDKFDMEKLVARIDRRINAGAEKPVASVRRLDRNRVEIRVSSDDAEAVKRIDRLLNAEGSLEFRILANRLDHADIIAKAKASNDEIVYEHSEADKSKTGKTELARWASVLEPSSTLHVGDEITRKSKSGKSQILVVMDEYNITGSLIEHAAAGSDGTGQPCIDVVFSRHGGSLFDRLTRENLPDFNSGFERRVAIILDGVVVCAPSIKDRIKAKAQITGKFSRPEVENLVAILNSGMLPVRVKRVDARSAD